MTDKNKGHEHKQSHTDKSHTHTSHKDDTKDKGKEHQAEDHTHDKERAEREHGSGQVPMSNIEETLAEEQRQQAQDLAKERGKEYQQQHQEALKHQEHVSHPSVYSPPPQQTDKKGRKHTTHYRLRVRDGHHYENDANGVMQEYGPGKTFLSRHPLHKQHPEKFSLVGEEIVHEEAGEQEGKHDKGKGK